MTLAEALHLAAWGVFIASALYAHWHYRKLRKVIFNDLRHRFAERERSCSPKRAKSPTP